MNLFTKFPYPLKHNIPNSGLAANCRRGSGFRFRFYGPSATKKTDAGKKPRA